MTGSAAPLVAVVRSNDVADQSILDHLRSGFGPAF